MKSMDVTIRICGSAGDGAIAAGQILNRAMALMGFHIMNFDSYPAEIRGFGKTVAHTRVSQSRVLTPGKTADCLIALNDPHAVTELGSLAEGGILIYDSKPPDYVEEDQAVAGFVEPGMIGYGVPLRELSTLAVKSSRSRNIVALGALAGIMRMAKEPFHEAISIRFGSKAEKVRESNIEAFDLGYAFAADDLVKSDRIDFGRRVLPRPEGEIAILSGNEAAARACIDAGIRLYAGYPITPATKIMEILAKELPKRGGVVIQAEDEISAAGHIVGGGFAGKRCATATSGPGLCLMVEFFNLAAMAEIPAVIIDCQRGGPSTGLPTKTEQSDFNLAAFGGSGDSPRPVLAPATVEECYGIVFKAFEIAEGYQTPVIVLLDFFLSSRQEDICWSDTAPASFGEYPPVPAQPGSSRYRRYALTDSGVSPRAVPGMDGCFHAVTGLEHDERGFPNYDPGNHQRMTRKRFRKMESLAAAWPHPEIVGPDGTLELGIISWGSSVGAAVEAVRVLRERGIRVGGLFPRLLWPLQPDPLRAFAARSDRLIVVEMNRGGQYARLIEESTHRQVERVCEVFAEPVPVRAVVDAVAGGKP